MLSYVPLGTRDSRAEVAHARGAVHRSSGVAQLSVPFRIHGPGTRWHRRRGLRLRRVDVSDFRWTAGKLTECAPIHSASPSSEQAIVAEEVHISSLVVHATPKRMQSVENAIA